MSKLDIPRDPAELARLSDTDEEYRAAKPSMGNFPQSPDLAQMVAMRDLPVEIPADPAVVQSEISIAARDGHLLRAIIFRPAEVDQDQKLPAVVLYHGGGYTIGMPEHNTDPARSIVKQLAAVVICPSYRLAPDHPFPQGINDAWDTFQWISKHLGDSSIGGSAEKGFVVGGVSAGANFASTLMHLARDNNLKPALTGVWLGCGSCCPAESMPEQYKSRSISVSSPECSELPLTLELRKIFKEAVKAPVTDPLHAALLWPSGHANLPPVYFQVAGRDLLRDESLIYADVLHESGVKVKVDIYKGLPHVFWLVFPQLSGTHKWRADIVENMRWLLSSHEN